MAPKKSIFRQDGARHFQLVHRSQRDPLIHDPEASTHVLKAVERENAKKGKSRAELEVDLGPDELSGNAREGEASLYGVYFDDSTYDYMQHLKPVGTSEAGVDSVLLEAPTTKAKGKAKLVLRDLPPEALPSTSELPRNYEDQEAIPSSIAGFRPDLDPHLRQALEALEDDAFVDDRLDDDFFGELIADGEREPEEGEPAFGSDDEDGFADAFAKAARLDAAAAEGEDAAEEGWEDRFAAFKKSQKAGELEGAASDDDDEGRTEGADTVGTLPRLAVVGGKRRRKGTSDASGYSMSSSSMFRNEGLTTLDERFDQIEKEYEEDEEDEPTSDDEDDDDDDEAPALLTSREDFDAMLDDFLDNYEILGRRMKPVLHGATPADKLAAYRLALVEGAPVRVRDGDDDGDDGEMLMPVDIDAPKDRWDCETILSTYSNLENHPRMIRARDSKPVPKIRIDPRTGMPVVEESKPKSRATKTATTAGSSSATDDASDDEDEHRPVRATLARPRDESKEEKKARKEAAKAEKQTRRVEKKSNKERFAAEFKQQRQTLAGQPSRRTHVL